MTNTHPTPVIPEPEAAAVAIPLETSHSVLSRAGISLLLFSLVFVFILSVSWVFLLPKLTRIQLGAHTVDLSVVVPYEQQLRAQIIEAEAKRNAIVLPVQDGAYDALKRQSICYPLLEDIRTSIAQVANDASGSADAVIFTSLAFDASGQLQISGDVRNVGPRSMTVLAQLIERLRKLPFIASLDAPAFARLNDAVIGFHSPFELSIALKPLDECLSTDSE